MAKKKEGSLLDYYGFSKSEQKKYPVITRILRQLTPERIKKEIEAVQRVKLSPELQKWIKEYEKVGNRTDFIWKWLYRMFKVVQFPIVSKKYQKSLWKTKTLLTIFIAQLDDVADKKQNKTLLNEILKIPLNQRSIRLNQLSRAEKKYLRFTIKLWKYIKKIIKKYPRYKEFEEIFNYDINQVFNAMSYSYLVNKNPYLINKTECWLYHPYNMVAFVYSNLDLMCSLNFDIRILGPLREVIEKSQKMARIGNWVSTWEREIKERDFANGIFAYAITSGIITVNELKQKNKLEIIKKIRNAKIEKKFLREWEHYYQEIKKLSTKLKKIHIKKFLLSLEKLIILHLTSQGYK